MSDSLALMSRDGAAASSGTAAATILVMDDDNAIRLLVSRILMMAGYEIQCTADGVGAMALYQQSKAIGRSFAAVILDLHIPEGMGGVETLQELMGMDPQVRAIVSSGAVNDPIMLNPRRYGFCDVLPKPYMPDELYAVLQRVLQETSASTGSEP